MIIEYKSNTKGCFGWLILAVIIIGLGCMSCSKTAIAAPNEQQVMVRVSKWHDLDWKFRDSSFVQVAWNLELLKYRDTTVFPITCPLSGIEIRYYKIMQ